MIQTAKHVRQPRGIAFLITAFFVLGGCSGNTDTSEDLTRAKPPWANPGNSGGNKPTATTDPTTPATGDTTTSGDTTTNTTTSGATTDTTTVVTDPSTTTSNTTTADPATPGTTTDASAGSATGDSTAQPGTTTASPEPATVQPVIVNTAVLLWQPPTTNNDGTALTDLQGYHIYAGTTATALARVASATASQTSYTVENLSTGTHYFAVSAFNSAGEESSLSNVASKSFAN